MSYNGYTNYETWNVALWIDNDQYSQSYWQHRTDRVKDVYELEQELKDYHNENMPKVEGTYADLLQSALDNVNWRELAEDYWKEYREDESEDEAEAE